MTNGFKVIGLSVRTTNKDAQAMQDLGKLWGQFFAENVMEKIPNKASGEIYAIYTDYKSDYTEEYTTIIGVPVTTLNEVPEGLTGREFGPEQFQKFTAKGEMPAAVGNTWMEIWQKDKELNRKYTYDYEVYGAKSQQGANSEVAIFIATK
ncbi:GyrI-like domain-containing protein [Chitinophaga sancti]|uniref:GyrI-like domain-containing protein n=1 Tax=Chitinophaga sancti TaxID=1004 RepID=A0A1K1RMZ9_9BACT|nr:GyrI-like domain-containing protein [Chitinophaga sancti]WQD62610.1 GyrI-like domain-containing protein [Chitinophaga sancti]WQG91820.1 GyrI-like domain-containing protein [Chitinophaga sancti]SFW73528.1 Predicted transcriptional regulator YdeE, contains AraC-type DNA-binding domain [Chitinophaga sancti]